MYSSIAHSCTNNTVVAGYHDSRRNTDTPYRSLWRYICSSCARAGVFLGIPVYRFALFTGSFWSCHYRPVNRDIDCTVAWNRFVALAISDRSELWSIVSFDRVVEPFWIAVRSFRDRSVKHYRLFRWTVSSTAFGRTDCEPFRPRISSIVSSTVWPGLFLTTTVMGSVGPFRRAVCITPPNECLEPFRGRFVVLFPWTVSSYRFVERYVHTISLSVSRQFRRSGWRKSGGGLISRSALFRHTLFESSRTDPDRDNRTCLDKPHS